MTWHCPTCAGTALPPSWVQVKTEWDALNDRERAAATHLLFGLQVYLLMDFYDDERPERGWQGEIADALRAFLPTFWEAWDVSESGVFRFLVPDPEDEPGRVGENRPT